MDGGYGKGRSAKAPVLTAAQLDKRLGLRRRAREDAERGLPGPDAMDLSGAELAVMEAVSQDRAAIDQARLDAKADAERRLRAGAGAQGFLRPSA